MATYAIGDIQGCYDEFIELLTLIDFNPNKDTLWLTGDLVNRGPASLKTLSYVKSLGKSAITVLGNHDLHLLAIGYQTTSRSEPSFDQILASPDRDELLEWLRQQPLIHFDPLQRALLVHAGLPPSWYLIESIKYANEVEMLLRGENFKAFLTTMYGNEPTLWDPTLTGNERNRYITNALTRMRYCRPNGALSLKEKFAPTGQDKDLTPWFMLREPPRDYRIIFGHWASLNGQCDKHNIIALDTGCVWGGALTAYCLEEQTFFSVKSRAKKISPTL